MRTSILSFSFFLVFITNGAFAFAIDSQFEPKSYVKPPPLHKTTSSRPIRVKRITSKPVPLEVKRLRAKIHPVSPPLPPITHRAPVVPLPIKIKLIRKNRLYIANKRHHHLTYATVYPGSLRKNIERIAGEQGWSRVVWNLPQDYRWVGKTRIAGHGLAGVFEKLLKSYPLQADFYEGNHVLVIIPRTLQ